MTGENRRENFGLEMERAEAALRSSRLLCAHGEAADAVSRAYYAMLHGARALLLVEGVEARTHRGVVHQVNLLFVRQGRLDPELGRALSRQQADREAADYESGAVFTREMCEESIAVAERWRCAGWRPRLEAEGFQSAKRTWRLDPDRREGIPR